MKTVRIRDPVLFGCLFVQFLLIVSFYRMHFKYSKEKLTKEVLINGNNETSQSSRSQAGCKHQEPAQPVKNTNIDPEGLTQSELPSGKIFYIKSKEIKQNTPVRQIVHSRDFKRYRCDDKKRIGGNKKALGLVPDALTRIDGAWFTCFDGEFKLEKGKCTVVSFGINTDPSFDIAIHQDYECRIEAFDPFIEADYFKEAREKAGPDAVSLNVTKDWRFHRIGLSNQTTDLTKIKGMASIDKLWEFTKLKNQTIDLFKMDIEQAEWPFLDNIDMDYFCAHVKQFFIETHPTSEIYLNKFTQRDLKMMRKLEKCFVLFHRNTRFFQRPFFNRYGTVKTEFEDPIQYKIPLNLFGNEQDLIDYMVTYGELYFVNRNFVKDKSTIFE